MACVRSSCFSDIYGLRDFIINRLILSILLVVYGTPFFTCNLRPPYNEVYAFFKYLIRYLLNMYLFVPSSHPSYVDASYEKKYCLRSWTKTSTSQNLGRRKARLGRKKRLSCAFLRRTGRRCVIVCIMDSHVKILYKISHGSHIVG